MADRERRIFRIHRETLVDKLVQNIQEAVFSGERPPKSKISEVGIAAEFGVSRVPAREALQRLEKMNLVRKTRSGREVAQFSPEEFRHVYELKNVVEAFGAMKGALNATPQEIAAIEGIVEKMADAVADSDIDRLQKLNYEFHDSLVFCCKNPQVIECFSSLAQQVRWAMSISLRVPDRPVMGEREHLEIFTAFSNRDAVKVRCLLETHSNKNMKRILRKMDPREDSAPGLKSCPEISPTACRNLIDGVK